MTSDYGFFSVDKTVHGLNSSNRPYTQAVPLAGSIFKILPARGKRSQKTEINVELFLCSKESKEQCIKLFYK